MFHPQFKAHWPTPPSRRGFLSFVKLSLKSLSSWKLPCYPRHRTHEADGILDFTERTLFPHKDDFVISAVPKRLLSVYSGLFVGKTSQAFTNITCKSR